MKRWKQSRQRDFLYRSIIKTRVELERRGVAKDSVKRLIARPGRSNLSWLAAVYGSDKGATAHRYGELYERHLSDTRGTTTKVLEIGVYKGGSLKMWRDYFPGAEVIGLDIEQITVDGPRIRVLQGDQSDPELLARVHALGPFDLIIDDGSHFAEHIAASFTGLYSAVKPGGWYVIEDMQTAYTPSYGGGAPGTVDTSVTLVQRLMDSVNREYVAIKYPDVAAELLPVDEIHVYPKIAFMQRSTAGK